MRRTEPVLDGLDTLLDEAGVPGQEALHKLSATQLLWFAVANQAILDLGRRRHRALALMWLISETSDPGSFRWVLSMLGIDPDSAQEGVRKLAFKRVFGAKNGHYRP